MAKSFSYLLPALLVLLFAAPLVADEPTHPYHTIREAPYPTENLSIKETAGLLHLRKWIDTLIFSKVEFKESTATEAINWTKQMSKEVSPDKSGMSFIISVSDTGIDNIKINLNLHNATLPQVLDEICRQMDYVWILYPYAVVLKPREEVLKKGY